jgi:hypothetical protein
MTEFFIVLCTVVSLFFVRRWTKTAPALGGDVPPTEIVHKIFWQQPDAPASDSE